MKHIFDTLCGCEKNISPMASPFFYASDIEFLLSAELIKDKMGYTWMLHDLKNRRGKRRVKEEREIWYGRLKNPRDV